MITLDNSRAFLSSIGIAGAIISTPGHSDDGIALILDDGAAFTGDLTDPVLILDPSRKAALVGQNSGGRVAHSPRSRSDLDAGLMDELSGGTP
ncbi:MAG: hypothetical protein U0528_07035 [Anaerolineae bacterium]